MPESYKNTTSQLVNHKLLANRLTAVIIAALASFFQPGSYIHLLYCGYTTVAQCLVLAHNHQPKTVGVAVSGQLYLSVY